MIYDLKHSSQRIGRLYPVLLDRDGNLIDGQHRLAADADWPKITLDHICSEKERLLARLVANVCRRTVPSSEKERILERLGRICLEEGEKPGKLAHKIADETGMSYTWVMKYLPSKYKQRPGLGGPSQRWNLDKDEANLDERQVTRRVTSEHSVFLSSPQKRIVFVKNYTNTNFVNLLIEKHFYEDLARTSERLGFSPEILINNAITLLLKQIEELASSMNNAPLRNTLSQSSSIH